jgi:polyisoprenoid-binding protein YceI
VDVRRALRRPRTWLIAVPVAVFLVAVVGPFLYINVIEGDPPDRLDFEDVSTTTAAPGRPTSKSAPSSGSAAGVDGTWKVGAGSQVGYRVGEVLFGQDTEAVGRTSDVTGTVTIAGTTISAASFTTDMTTVRSDQSRRDGQFHNRIMETSQFPEATFRLTGPITLPSVPVDGAEITVEATGEFTIHGVTRPATFPLTAKRDGATIQLNGSIPVVFADYGIDDPSGGPATVKDHGEIEVLLVLQRA